MNLQVLPISQFQASIWCFGYCSHTVMVCQRATIKGDISILKTLFSCYWVGAVWGIIQIILFLWRTASVHDLGLNGYECIAIHVAFLASTPTKHYFAAVTAAPVKPKLQPECLNSRKHKTWFNNISTLLLALIMITMLMPIPITRIMLTMFLLIITTTTTLETITLTTMMLMLLNSSNTNTSTNTHNNTHAKTNTHENA